jgi:hypothetical protein
MRGYLQSSAIASLVEQVTLLLALAGSVHASTTWLVDSDADSADVMAGDGVCDDGTGHCTLRAAIVEAQSGDAIHFNLGAGVPLVTVGTINGDPLPIIRAAVSIDGATGGATRVELNGPHAWIGGAYAHGLTIAASGASVRHMVINGFSGAGIDVDGDGVTGVTITDNFIGTDATGMLGVSNSYGIDLAERTSANVVQDNVLSGNDYDGIEVRGRDQLVQGNWVGLDATGAGRVQNNYTGITIHGSGQQVIGNVVAGQLGEPDENTMGAGIVVLDGDGHLIADNRLGWDSAGTTALPNTLGVVLVSGSGITIQHNVVANSLVAGITLSDNFGPLSGVLVTGNQIDAGTAENTSYGILVVGPTTTHNIIQDNLITRNGAGGISTYDLFGIRGPAGPGNMIRGNSIFANGGLGISLTTVEAPTSDPASATPNDPGDADSGPNDLQNYPVLSSVGAAVGARHPRARVEGTLNSLPGRYILEFFANSSGAQGERLLLTKKVKIKPNETTVTFRTRVKDIGSGEIVTVTATSLADFSTSEFSPGLAVP